MSAEIVQTLTVHDVFKSANCSDHPLNITEADLIGAKTLIAMAGCDCHEMNMIGETCGSFCDSQSFAIAQLADDRFVLIAEWSDSSGHGCQCGGVAYVRDSLGDVYRELDREQRALVSGTKLLNGEALDV